MSAASLTDPSAPQYAAVPNCLSAVQTGRPSHAQSSSPTGSMAVGLLCSSVEAVLEPRLLSAEAKPEPRLLSAEDKPEPRLLSAEAKLSPRKGAPRHRLLSAEAKSEPRLLSAEAKLLPRRGAPRPVQKASETAATSFCPSMLWSGLCDEKSEECRNVLLSMKLLFVFAKQDSQLFF